MTTEEINKAFEFWWFREGSGDRPKPTEDTEEFAYRLTRTAWLNGAYIATEKGVK